MSRTATSSRCGTKAAAAAAGLDQSRATPPTRSRFTSATAARAPAGWATRTGFNAYVLRGSDGAVVRRGRGLDDRRRATRLSARRITGRIEGRNIVRSAHARGVQGEARRSRRRWSTRSSTSPSRCIPRTSTQGYAVGHGDRPEHLHRLQAPASSPARPRTTSRWSARTRCARNREMHWLRIDRYYTGAARQSRTPTSSRCPASSARTRPARWSARSPRRVHSDEGLNDMVYNRCVGTRYCSNNCPYKVRRFNFLLYQDWNTPHVQAAAQPRRHGPQPRRHGEVHLLRAAHQRSAHPGQARGARRSATARCSRPASRPARPTRSCSATSTTRRARVAKLKASPRNYATLEELNTRPRTTYLAAVRNPQPALPRTAHRRRARDRGAATESSEQH